MNMLYFLDGARRKGNGTRLVSFWESEMRALGYDTVMTSTLADEEGQFFYRRLGYTDSGALFLPGESAEIIFIKKI